MFLRRIPLPLVTAPCQNRAVTSVGAGRVGSVEAVVEVVPDAPPLAPVPTRGPEPERGPMHLDEISKAIVEQLQQDGRRSYAKIATAVGLSEAAVRQRVARLTDAGVMQIVAVTNPLQLGFRRQAMLGIKAEGNLDPVVAALSAMPEVDYVVITAGSFDVLAEVVCEDDDHLLALLNNQVRTIPGVRATESFVYLKLSKQTYQWGTR
jgi:Lrp/AsnC family transcriptional regulator for asnA, asnC and gidA